MNYFSEVYGLVTKNDPVTESGGLFLAHYFTLQKVLGIKPTQSEMIIYNEKMLSARVSKGLYKRSLAHTERTVSHDEISGMLIASNILGTFHGDTIVNYLTLHLGCYPATGKWKFYNPGDYFAWQILTGKKFLAFLSFPFYLINLIISSNMGMLDTSSKLIYFSELYNMKEKSFTSKLLWKYFSHKMRNQYGKYWVGEMFYICFYKTEEWDYPLLKLSRGIAL